MRSWARAGLIALASLAALAGARPSAAAALRFCEQPSKLSPAEQDRLFRFAAVVKQALDASGQRVALIARSGTNLDRLGLRYSHAGVSLLRSDNTPWSVRQLYYACDEGQPRLFDQGLLGFVLGTDDAALGYLSVVLLPEAEAEQLERTALNRPQALGLLNPAYSANAYAWGTTYQNCNQWLVELLAAAWGSLPALPAGPAGGPNPVAAQRSQAQAWLHAQAYQPTAVAAGLLMWPGLFVPWVHNADHPRDDLAAGIYRVSMPEAIEAFVHARLPGARRIEFCHNARQVVIHPGWTPLAEGCQPGEGDSVVTLD